MARLKAGDSNSAVVWSDDKGGSVAGSRKERCDAVAAPAKAASTTPADGVVRVRRERAGRGGKTVTTITGVQANDADLQALAKTLKTRCGAGGAVKERVIELQGDKVDVVMPLLEQLGYRVKRAGG